MIEKKVKIFGRDLQIKLRNDGDHAIANEVFGDRDYKPCETALKEAKNSVIDIGGHLGFFSLYAASLNSKVPIFCYEPHEGNFALLKEHLRLNRIKNVKAKRLAVANHQGQSTLLVSKEHLNHSIVHAIEDTNETQAVDCITLEKIIDRHRLGQVDLLKMDCEGAEFQILMDSKKCVLDKVSSIFLEYHDWVPSGDHHKLKAYLEKMGFKVKDMPNHKMRELGYLWCTK